MEALAGLTFLAGRVLYHLYQSGRTARAAWIAIWAVFTAALFLTAWYGITVVTSIGAAETPGAIFLRWTALTAAGLTMLVQPLVMLWLYIVNWAVRQQRQAI